MITRLQVSGFKNLVDVDVRFGPFTCIAGANGTGKSNLFDAIQFLSRLADDTFASAAMSIHRGGGTEKLPAQSLFHRIGNVYDNRISLSAEMIIPTEGVDDLGQPATAAITFLRYSIELAYHSDESLPALGAFRLIQEELEHINISEASRHIRFPHSAKEWRRSVIKGRRTAPFISTDEVDGEQIVRLSQDGVGGRPKSFLAANLPRAVLSTANATESPTAFLARREMQSWRLFQLEPSSLRLPDDFFVVPGLSSDGRHLPATLYYMMRNSPDYAGNGALYKRTRVYEQLAARLSELLTDDVYEIVVDRNERRQTLTLQVKDRNGTIYPASELSDGTLRFLALAVLELSPISYDVICLEEPENGIHPARVEAILRLLQDIAVDVEYSVDSDNPLRQVIINTHSPAVVNLVPPDSLLIAETEEAIKDGIRYRKARFRWLPDTWRCEADPDERPVIKGRLLAYLNPIPDGASQLALELENVDNR